MRKLTIVTATLALCLTAVPESTIAEDAPGEAPLATIGQPADNGARIVTVETVDARTRDLTIESPSVGTEQVRLLLPEAFDEEADPTFPVLYLLHGGGGGYTDWTEETDVEGITMETGLLVAMPAAASTNLGARLERGGPDGQGGPPNWERFHLLELPQLLERNWRAGEARVIGGLSLGGYGTVMYAARHPGLFRAAASYSGVLDVTVNAGESAEAEAIAEQATQAAEAMGWAEANPINLLPSLRGTPMYISYGNGEPGPLDPADREQDALEAWVSKGDDNFVAALAEAGIPASVNAYGPGTHSWPYWNRELEASLPLLLRALDEDPSQVASPAP